MFVLSYLGCRQEREKRKENGGKYSERCHRGYESSFATDVTLFSKFREKSTNCGAHFVYLCLAICTKKIHIDWSKWFFLPHPCKPWLSDLKKILLLIIRTFFFFSFDNEMLTRFRSLSRWTHHVRKRDIDIHRVCQKKPQQRRKNDHLTKTTIWGVIQPPW